MLCSFTLFCLVEMSPWFWSLDELNLNLHAGENQKLDWRMLKRRKILFLFHVHWVWFYPDRAWHLLDIVHAFLVCGWLEHVNKMWSAGFNEFLMLGIFFFYDFLSLNLNHIEIVFYSTSEIYIFTVRREFDFRVADLKLINEIGSWHYPLSHLPLLPSRTASHRLTSINFIINRGIAVKKTCYWTSFHTGPSSQWMKKRKWAFL